MENKPPDDRSRRRVSDTGEGDKVVEKVQPAESTPEKTIEEHLRVDRDSPLCLGAAVHMITAAARSHLHSTKGYVYIDTHQTDTSSMYLSERFVLENFSAVLRIKAGRLEAFPKTSKLVRATAP